MGFRFYNRTAVSVLIIQGFALEERKETKACYACFQGEAYGVQCPVCGGTGSLGERRCFEVVVPEGTTKSSLDRKVKQALLAAGGRRVKSGWASARWVFPDSQIKQVVGDDLFNVHACNACFSALSARTPFLEVYPTSSERCTLCGASGAEDQE